MPKMHDADKVVDPAVKPDTQATREGIPEIQARREGIPKFILGISKSVT